MAGRTFHFPGFSIVEGNVKVDISLNRFEKQFREAQYKLDGMIMTDMEPLMPKNAGMLVDSTRSRSAALQGSGLVCAAAGPYGRFQYYGKVMVGKESGSPWAKKGEKKVVTDQNLKYSNPNTVPKWFEKAKENHGKIWIKEVKKIAGGG